MKYKTLNDFKEERHPWEPYIPPNADKIILGTFPTVEKYRGAYEFFYPNPNNNFWRVIFNVANKRLEDFKREDPIKVRMHILSELNLGISDI